MAVVRRSIYLLLSLWLLLSGCSQVQSASPAPSTPTPSHLAQPTLLPAIAPNPVEESSPQAKAVAPSPELRPIRLRMAMLPPPKELPPAPTPPRVVVSRSPPPAPSLSREASYPKARPSASVLVDSPSSPPTSLSLEATYPKAKSSALTVKKAEAASMALDRLIQSGQLLASFHGTGNPREMVYFHLVNQSHRPVQVRLDPGMILNPGEHQRVQPLLVTEEINTVIQPGESLAGNLLSYCMDSRVPAPLPGQPVDYRFSPRTQDGGPEAVLAHQAAQDLVKSSPYRHAITQIAIWKSLNQPVEDKHFHSVLGPSANDPQVRQEVIRQVDRVLKSLRGH